VDATTGQDRVWLSLHALREALGWELKPEGMCKGDLCVPVVEPDLIGEEGVDLRELSDLLARPLALDTEERVACLGVSAADQSAMLHSLEAPDFTLPDLDGKLHSLSDYRGKKVLLVAYASW
jgi:hypothetical protein